MCTIITVKTFLPHRARTWKWLQKSEFWPPANYMFLESWDHVLPVFILILGVRGHLSSWELYKGQKSKSLPLPNYTFLGSWDQVLPVFISILGVRGHLRSLEVIKCNNFDPLIIWNNLFLPTLYKPCSRQLHHVCVIALPKGSVRFLCVAITV